MSTLLDKLKRFWAAFLAGFVFVAIGICTILWILLWTPVLDHGVLSLAVYCFAILMGLLEIYEGIKILRIPFKSK